MREFQKQSAQMDMTVRYFILYLRKYMPFYHFALEHQRITFLNVYMQTEMMSEAIDDSLDNDEAEEETEELTNQVIFHEFFNFQLDFTSLRLVKECIPCGAKGFMNRKLYSLLSFNGCYSII